MMTKRLSIIGFFIFLLSMTWAPGIIEKPAEGKSDPDIYLAGFFPRSSRGSYSPFNKTRHKKRPYKIKKDHNLKDSIDYQKLLSEIRTVLMFQEYDAYKNIENLEVLTNWQIGVLIRKHVDGLTDDQGYEAHLITNLSVDLSMSKRKLYRMITFNDMYKCISDISRKLTWQHYIILMDVQDDEERVFYQKAAIDNAWDAGELQRQIRR